MWNLYPFLSPNSGLTPPYAQTPSTGGQFPFYPPWAKPTGGTGMVPFKDRFPMMPPAQGTSMVPVDNTPKLPAVRSTNPLVKSGGLSSILDLLRPLAGNAVVQGAAKSFLGGPMATGINAAAMAMKPTPMGAEPDLYVRDASGKMVPNMANPIVTQLMSGNGGMTQQPQAGDIPMPRPDPRDPLSGVLAQLNPRLRQTITEMRATNPDSSDGGQPVPLPRPRPNMPTPYDGNPFYYGPGSQNFGAEGPSGNTYGQGPGLLSLLFRK